MWHCNYYKPPDKNQDCLKDLHLVESSGLYQMPGILDHDPLLSFRIFQSFSLGILPPAKPESVVVFFTNDYINELYSMMPCISQVYNGRHINELDISMITCRAFTNKSIKKCGYLWRTYTIYHAWPLYGYIKVEQDIWMILHTTL